MSFEYFVIIRSSDNTIPLISNIAGTTTYFHLSKPVYNPKQLQFKFAAPIPRKPQLADYHSSPGSVISTKIHKALSKINFGEGVQFLPACIIDKEGEKHNNYWGIHNYQRIRCIDVEKSDCIIGKHTFELINKLILDVNILGKIPLENRLIFRLREQTSMELFHKSVMEKIMSVDPIGVRFVPIEKWNSGSLFG